MTTCSSRSTCCYELHYRGFPGVDDAWEWEPSLLALRGGLERQFEDALREAVPRPARRRGAGGDRSRPARDCRGRRGPSLSRHIEREADARAGPRVPGAPLAPTSSRRRTRTPGRSRGCAGAAEGGARRDPGRRVRRRPARAHARGALRRRDGGARARRRYGAYLDAHPGRDARHREPDVVLRAAPAPSRRHRRPPGAVRDDLLDPQPPLRDAACAGSASAREATDFFDEHVEADAVHENIAAVDLAGGLAREEPAVAGDRVGSAVPRRARPSLGRPSSATRRARAPAGRRPRARARRAPARRRGRRRRRSRAPRRPRRARRRSGRARAPKPSRRRPVA